MRHVRRTAAVVAALMAPAFASAQEAPEFYRNKTINVVVGTGPVGTYAAYAQLLNEFMPRHIPGNPTMVFQSMPGAGGLAAANHAFNVAPKDGTHLLVVVQTVAVEQALGSKAVRYDASKFNFIGRMVDNTPILVGWTAKGVDSIDVVRRRETVIGGAGATSPTDIMPKLLNATAGAKFKLISGYKGIDDLMLAMQRGETEAMVASIASFQTVFAAALTEKRVHVLAQLSLERRPDLPDTPTAAQLSDTEEGRAVADFVAAGSDIGRALITTPGVPEDRLKILRSAFQATMADPGFRETAKKRMLTLDGRDHQQMQKVVTDTLNTPPDVIKKARAILGVM